MSSRRRDFLSQLLAAGAFPGLFARPGAFALLLDPQTAQQVNPDFDAQSYNFWSGFTAKSGRSAVLGTGQTRGAGSDHTQPVFLHHGPDGFRNAALLDQSKLVEEGDVVISMNTSAIKVGDDDQKTFDRVQNAQLRVDVAQKTAIIPLIEAMAYTVVGAMSSAKASATPAKSASTSKSSSSAARWRDTRSEKVSAASVEF
jgi:hypothetical protein